MREESYHLIGIGGIGMSALARVLLEQKKRVSGSDLKESATTKALQRLGATIYPYHSASHIHEGMQVVYSTDIHPENEERKRAESLGLKLLHRCECLDLLMRNKKPLLITGCHGKTSTTALVATLLMEGGLDPSFVIGGYVRHLMTNGKHGEGKYFVAEADESDGSFLKSRGWGAIVTNTDEDHISYWKSKENLLEAYHTFLKQTESHDVLFLCAEDPFLASLKLNAQYYGFEKGCQLRITRMEQEGFFSEFDLTFEGKEYRDLKMPLQGKHQVLNATAAVGMALKLGVAITSIKKTLLHYGGVKRRLELIGEVDNIQIFDDYAHHPAEVITTLKALKTAISSRRLPSGRLIVVFQPHRYTRLERHLLEFAEAFDVADICLVTEVYGAGEPPIAGVTAAALLEKMVHPQARCIPSERVIEELVKLVKPFDSVMTVGAGDVTEYGPLLLKKLREVYGK